MNLRPSGYEPDELPDCSTPHQLEGHINGTLGGCKGLIAAGIVPEWGKPLLRLEA